jgi:hypothetical protein
VGPDEFLTLADLAAERLPDEETEGLIAKLPRAPDSAALLAGVRARAQEK